MDPRDRPEQLFTLVHLGHARTFNDEITEDVIFSVASSQEGGIGIEVGSSTMHMQKHCSVSEGAPLNSSGYGEEQRALKMYALSKQQSLRAGDKGSSSTKTQVPDLWLDSGATHHVVGDVTILKNLRDLPAGMVVTVANGSQLPVTKSKIVIIFYEKHADLWLEGTWIGGAIIDGPKSLYALRYLKGPCLQEGGIDIMVGSSTMHVPKHCSVSEGAPLNSSGYGDSKMYALVMPQSLSAGDGGSSATETQVPPPLWLDSGAAHHVVGDHGILTNLQAP